MKTQPRSNVASRMMTGACTVLVVGGCGGMVDRYREVAERRGWQLRYYERRIPPAARHDIGKVSLVVIIVSMISHSLRQQVLDAIGTGTQVVYAKSASASALRAAIPEIAAAA